MSRPLSLILLTSLLLGMETTAASDQKADFISTGLKKQDKGDVNGAIADFTKAIQSAPNGYLGYLFRGNAKLEKIEGVRKVGRLKEVKRGKRAPSPNDIDDAIKDLDRALQLAPYLPQGFRMRGILKSYKNDVDGAIADFTQSIGFTPENFDANDQALTFSLRGQMEVRKNDLDGAIADFNKAINLRPTNPAVMASVYNYRGLAKKTKGDVEGAALDLAKASELQKVLGANK
jgi:tetratricopeptide (TPR) repeat protein